MRKTEKKMFARKKWRGGSTERRLAKKQAERSRARTMRQEVCTATHNVRTMAVHGKHGIRRVWEVLSTFGKMGCDVIGIQETHRSGPSIFVESRYNVYCSGESGGESQKRGQGGVGLAVKQTLGTQTTTRPPEFISDRLLKVTLDLRGRAKAVSFVVAYAPTETADVSRKNIFWAALDSAVKDVPPHEQLFVLMDANARTGKRREGGVGSKDNEVLGAYGRDTLNDNGERLLTFAANHGLALVNTFFSTRKSGTSRTFNGSSSSVTACWK